MSLLLERSQSLLNFSSPRSATTDRSLLDDDLARCHKKSRPFDRFAQLSFDATVSVEFLRSSSSFPLKQQIEEKSVWKIQPPDFRPQVYRPRPPKRNSREAIRPWTYHADCDTALAPIKNREDSTDQLNNSPKQLQQLNEPFVARFKELRSFDSRVAAVKDDTLPQQPFKDLKAHDFRGVS